MFDRDEELNNIMTFRPHDIIKAVLQTLPNYDLKLVRMRLDPHWSDTYNPSLDPYFDKATCKLCGSTHILNRKEHFHYHCKIIKRARNNARSAEEFESIVRGAE